MTARGRLLSKLPNGSLPPWAIKVLVGSVFLLVSWGVWVTASTFETNNSRFTDAEGTALTARVNSNVLDLAVQDQRLLGVEGDIAEIKDMLKDIQEMIRDGQ